MRTIDIFVSSPADVQKERAVAEQLIRSVAAEFNLPINVSYSNPLRGSKEEDETSVEREDFGNESNLVLSPCFWEYPELEGDDFLDQIPNTGQFDLVICILWSRLGTTPVQKCVMPDGSRPRSATDYEVAWVLDQSKQTPGFPCLHVYRNRATPVARFEPKEKRETLCRQWDAVQEFCTAWEKNGGTEFRECCHDYQDVEEFENLFREHFRDFLRRQLDWEIGLGKAERKVRHTESNPFRGLNSFDFEHAALYHGRTKAVGEVLDALKNQATAKKPFVLVLGPTGSGKSSLVQAGVLPLLTVDNGPWRRAVTRPGAGDPFDALAAALLGKFALPELQDVASSDEWRNLASQLRKDPDVATARIREELDQLTRQELDRPELRLTPRFEYLKAGLTPRFEYSKAATAPKSRGRVKPKMRLALVVDQLEELFTGVSPVLQRKYIAALCALASCERVFIIATLRSDFYAQYQKFPELVELTAFGGRYELQPPTPRGIGNMIRFPAEAAGLRFERDPETNRSLDEALVTAAIASPEPLPLLEHLLSRLYQRQLDRKDGLLLWSDYHGLGELQDALAQHAETVFLTLKRDEQQALKFVIRRLVALGRGEEDRLIRRTVPYGDLVSSPELNQRQRAGAKGLVDRLIKEGLLNAVADAKQEPLISVPQEALLRRWPGVWQWLSEDQHFFRMRDRLDASLERWLSRDRQSGDLLDSGIGLAEAETLLRDFGSSLSERQIDYIRKSLARQKRHRWVRDNIGLAAIAGLAVFAVCVGIERFNAESRRKNRGQDLQLAQPNADLATGTLETQLRKAEEKAQLAQQNADLATSQRSALETRLKKAQEEKTQIAQLSQQVADLASSRRSALETQLKKAQEEKALAQQNADLAASQRSVLETQLKKTEEKAQLAQQNTDLASSQRSALETQLKKAQEEKAQLAQLAQQNADLAASQRSALETQLKKTEEKAQLAQQNTDLASSQRSALETQLKKAEEKAQLAQQNADLATSQRSALEIELKKAQEEKALAKQNADLAASQRAALETQLKKAQEEKAQLAQLSQQNADLAASQRSALEIELKKVQEEKARIARQSANLATSQQSALETQLKKAQEEKAQLAQLSQQNADLASSQRSALETQLKKAEEKAQLAQQNTDLASTQRSALETQLKKIEEKAQLAQQNADLASSQRSALETQLKKAQEEKTQLSQLSQKNADLASSQRSALETQLKKAQEEKAQLAQQSQQIADLASSQRSALETQLKKAEEKAQLAQQNTDLAFTQRSALETQLKKAQEKAQLAQQNADLASSQRSALETQLKKAQEEKAQLARQNANLATSQQSALETQLKKAEEKAQLAQQNADLAASQRSALETQLKAEEKAQLAQQNADLASSQRSALETQLKKAEEKAQQNTDLATSQRSALETQLKKAQEEKAQVAQLAKQNADLAASQRSALETQLKKAQEEKAQLAQLAQQNADLAASQRSALEIELKKVQEEKARIARQSANLATSQQSALETQLKKAQEEKALAQQNADLATSQRSALETQLKKAEEKAQLAQQNADLATSQRSGLEIELKKAEEKAQLGQQNTNLAFTQRSALETQLKKAEEKAQLAQQNTDLATSQRSALETQLKKAEEKAQLAQQNADLATSQRSALEIQLKEAQEEKARIAQQNANLAISQRSALETELKNEQVKLQQVQANADRAASRLGELETQLRQEQEREQKAQANADFATSELRGMRLVNWITTPLRALKIQPPMNDRNSRSGADATFAWFMAAVNPEENQDGLQWGKYARLNPPQEISPTPLPSTKESEASNPPESQFDRSAEASGEEEFLKEFVLGYLRTVASNDTSMQRRYFAERVNFYGRGVLNSSNLEASTQHYHEEWPVREWAPRGEAKVVRSSNPNLFVVYQPFNWTVSDGSRTARGNAILYLRIRKNSQGEFRIVDVHQLDR